MSHHQKIALCGGALILAISVFILGTMQRSVSPDTSGAKAIATQNQTPCLSSVQLDPTTPPTTSLHVGAANVVVTRFKVLSSGCNLSANAITFDINGSYGGTWNIGTTFSSFQLFANGVAVTAPFHPTMSPFLVQFTQPLLIPQNATQVFEIKATINGGANASTTSKFKAGTDLVYMAYPGTWNAPNGGQVGVPVFGNLMTIIP